MSDAFGMLLRQHRLRRRLSQEALAERAAVSSRSIRALEHGRARSPRPRTVDQLAAALDLAAGEREDFVAAGQELFWTHRAEEPAGAGEPAATTDTEAVVAPPRLLPVDLGDFVGRDDELGALGEALDPADPGRVVAISGPPGVGKSALAVHAAHRYAARFPDGQLYAALRGAGHQPADPADVLGDLLRFLGVDGSALPAGVDARAAMFRARLAGRRMLLVLDDAAGHLQVHPLLSGIPAIVTSRPPLTGLAGVTTLDLRPLPERTAIRLLSRVAGADRVSAERSAAAALVDACGGLPLAVRIAGARLAARPGWTVETLRRRLADERHRLDELRHGDLAVRPGLRLAYRALSPAAAEAFALLGALRTHTFPEWSVAALLGAEPVAAATATEELLDSRLLDEAGPDATGHPRYRFHDVIGLYAWECRREAVDESAWQAALARTAGGWLALLRLAQQQLCCERLHLDDPAHPATAPDSATGSVQENALVWFDAERAALAAVVTRCAEADLATTARCLAGCAADFYALRGHYDEWDQVTRVALEACRRAGDRAGEAAMLRCLGACQVETDMEAALVTLGEVRTMALEVGDRTGAAMALRDLGYVLSLGGRLGEAEEHLNLSARELQAAGRHSNRVVALSTLGFVRRQRGDTAGAVRAARSALALARSCDDVFFQAYASRGLAGALLADGRPRLAVRAAREAATLFTSIGDPIGAAQSMRTLGEALAQEPRRLTEAERAFGSAAAVFRRHGHEWGVHLVELSLGEVEVRRGSAEAAERLTRCLEYWTAKGVPALRARTLVALAGAAELAGDAPATRAALLAAYELYRELGAPAADDVASRLADDS